MTYHDKAGVEITRDEWAALGAVKGYGQVRRTEDAKLGHLVETEWVGLATGRCPEVFLTESFLVAPDGTLTPYEDMWAETLADANADHDILLDHLKKRKRGK